MKLMNFVNSKMGEKYDKKYATFKEFGSMINNFLEKKEQIANGSYYLKIRELYNILDLYEQFDSVFDHIKNRLKAIKIIHDKSDQFNNMIENLNKAINTNQDKFKSLVLSYELALNEFKEFGESLSQINELDNLIKIKLI